MRLSVSLAMIKLRVTPFKFLRKGTIRFCTLILTLDIGQVSVVMTLNQVELIFSESMMVLMSLLDTLNIKT